VKNTENKRRAKIYPNKYFAPNAHFVCGLG